MFLKGDKEFIIGCNYWASNAGTEMWKEYDEAVIRKDLQILLRNGVKYLRVFPIWRDFQPVIPVLTSCAMLDEYRMADESKPENIYYLDKVMLSRFSSFCDICEEMGIKLIVGLITGWMSGRTFVPPALYNKDLYTDPAALLFEQKLIMGLVSEFKNKRAICAWDIGNECGVLGEIKSEDAAKFWTQTMVNAVRACDHERAVISGMHLMEVQPNLGGWSIESQRESCDCMVTHPYPLWSKYAYKDYTGSYRTMIFSAFLTKLYSDISGKPCLVEEIGTMGPMICSDKLAADYARINMLSSFANGAEGFMWWCANDQTNLRTHPYTSNMCELELGMIDVSHGEKTVLKEFKAMSDVFSALDFKLPKATCDAVCILTKDQDNEAVGYMAYALAKQAGINMSFSYCEDKLPESDLYIMPSVCGNAIMSRENYLELKKRVHNGATLYISNDTGVISEFEELTGLRVLDSGRYSEELTSDLNGEAIRFKRNLRYKTEPVTAEVIACDDLGIPAVTINEYGSGRVYYVNFPLEKMLIDENDAFDTNRYLIYREISADKIKSFEVVSDNPNIAITRHKQGDKCHCIALNYSDKPQKLNLKLGGGYEVDAIHYGDIGEIKPFDGCIFTISLHN